MQGGLTNPAFLQKAVLQDDGGMHRIKFTNASNQMMYPGTLAQFHAEASKPIRPPAFQFEDPQLPMIPAVMRQLVGSRTADNWDTLSKFHAEQNPPQDDWGTAAPYLTTSQRVWKVPLHMAQLRATEYFQ